MLVRACDHKEPIRVFLGIFFTAARENKGSLLSVVSFTLVQSFRVGAVGTFESVGEIRDAERVVLVAWEEGQGQLP